MNLRFALVVEPDNPDLLARVKRVTALRDADQPSVPSTLTEEKATNPFLRSAEPVVIAKALELGAVNRSPVAVFTAIRQWRNSF